MTKSTLYSWRDELREVVDEIETKAEKKVKETKGINNKVVINPSFKEAVEEIGGELLEVKEVDKDQEDLSLKQKEKQANNMKRRVLLQKLRAVRSGAGDSIMASHQPEGEQLDEVQTTKKDDARHAAMVDAVLNRKEQQAIARKKSEKQKAAARKSPISAKRGITPAELKKYDTDGDGKVRVVNASFSNWRNNLVEKDLSAAERRALPDSEFALPGKGKGPEGKQAGSYPIPDEEHARMALAMVAKHGTPQKKAEVRAAVKKKFPDIEISEAVKGQDNERRKAASADRRSGERISKKEAPSETKKFVKNAERSIKWHDKVSKGKFIPGMTTEAKVDTGKSADEKATARNLRNTPPGADKDTDLKTFITRKPGESLDKARQRVRQGQHAARRGVSEDKAFDYVVGMLRKKYGESGVLTKDSPKPKPRPKQKPKPDTRTPEQKKKDQDKANMDAVYGRTPWNKEGSLGT